LCYGHKVLIFVVGSFINLLPFTFILELCASIMSLEYFNIVQAKCNWYLYIPNG
jgi:hypothetical protein